MKSRRLILVLLLTIGIFEDVGGQAPVTRPGGATKPGAKPNETAKEKTPEAAGEGAELTATQQRGLNLIRQIGEQVGDIDDRRNSARMQAAAADLLWPHDSVAARKMFEEAFSAAVKYYEESKDDNRMKIGEDSWVTRKDVIVEIVRMINKHDRKMGEEYAEKYIEAKKKIQAGRPVNGRDFDKLFGGDYQSSTELLGMADSMIEADAKLASRTAMKAVAAGITPMLASFLPRMAGKDRAAADQVYLAALERVKADPAPMPGQLLVLAAYPFGEGRVQVIDGGNNSSWGFGRPKDFTIDPKIVRAFLTAAYATLNKLTDPAIRQLPDAASRFGAAFYAARSLEPKIVEFQPGLHEPWQVMTNKFSTLAADQARRQIDDQLARESERKQGRSQDPLQPADNVDALLKSAQNAKNFEERDAFYAQAALAAEGEGETSRALDIAGSINKLTLRGNVKSWVNFEASRKAIHDKRYDDARKHALDVEASDQRAYLFFELARTALGDSDRARAMEFLEEGVKRVSDADDSYEKARALLGLSNLYAKLDYNRSFEIATAAVQTANKLSIDKSQFGEDEARLARSISSAHGTMTTVNTVDGFDAGKVFVELSRHDLDRALNLAQSFDNKSVRYSTMLAIAGSMVK